MRIARQRPINSPVASSSNSPSGGRHPVRPLLKWAGGKRQLLPQLRPYYPAVFGRYIEPFFGSGAVFFDLYGAGRLAGHDAVLIDSNADLIGVHETVRDAPEKVARALERLARGHERGGREHYYAVRDAQFNPQRDHLRRADGRIAYTPELAAMLIYLNRTGFNGLFRVNAQGAFNVPAGRYERPNIANHDQLARVADALADPRVRLVWGSFETVLDIAERGDFIYFDPPYAPLSRTANFTSYTARRFDGDDQARLQQTVIALARRGCHVVVSNSTADEIAALYERSGEARAAGLRTTRVAARRSINRSAVGRGQIEEFLISNVQRP
ncbi:MAG TPA: Dam family site-specific DNA-(adenine-N6)-methyltransferase [Vicinamibacterales bacterium]